MADFKLKVIKSFWGSYTREVTRCRISNCLKGSNNVVKIRGDVLSCDGLSFGRFEIQGVKADTIKLTQEQADKFVEMMVNTSNK